LCPPLCVQREKDYEGKGAVSATYLAIMKKTIEKGYRWGEAFAIDEENIRSLQAIEGAGVRVYHRFR
jgi:hypothetical protein